MKYEKFKFYVMFSINWGKIWREKIFWVWSLKHSKIIILIFGILTQIHLQSIWYLFWFINSFLFVKQWQLNENQYKTLNQSWTMLYAWLFCKLKTKIGWQPTCKNICQHFYHFFCVEATLLLWYFGPGLATSPLTLLFWRFFHLYPRRETQVHARYF